MDQSRGTSGGAALAVGVAVYGLLIAVGLGIGGQAGHGLSSHGVELGVPLPDPVPVGTNRRAALDAAAGVLAAFPVPAGARAVASAPTSVLAQARPPGARVQETGWWVVPLGVDDVLAWYAANVPALMTEDPGNRRPPVDGRGALHWRLTSSSQAYTRPDIHLSYASGGEARTFVEVEVSATASSDRTAETLVPRSVQEIEVVEIESRDTRVIRSSHTIRDRSALADVVAAFDGLAGGAEVPAERSCSRPAPGGSAYEATFRWPGHSLRVTGVAPGCATRTLVRDGHRLGQTLGTAGNHGSLDDALRRATASAGGGGAGLDQP